MQRYAELPPSHRSHLVLPPDDEVRTRFDRLLLDPVVRLDVPPIHVCGVDRAITFRPENTELPDGVLPAETAAEDYVHHLRARTLDDLKEWIGVPNRAFGRASSLRESDPLRGVRVADLPVAEEIDYERLAGREKAAVSALCHGLLHGEVDAKLIEHPPFKAVAEHMVRCSTALPAFVGNTLYVCDGDTVRFSGFAFLTFDHVIVEGTGRLFLGPGTKLHAYQIAHT